MALTQAPGKLWSADSDPIDLLVPPPRSFRHSLILTGVTALVLVVIACTGSSGLLWPKLALDPDASYTAAGPTTKPSLTFNVQNDGYFPLSIVGVDARAPGLSQAEVTIAQLGVGGKLGPGRGFALTLDDGGVAHITVTFTTWNCQAIQSHGSNTVPIHLSNRLGLDATVSVLPGLHFDPPSAGVQLGLPDAHEISWAAGITWTNCHPGSGAPNIGSPSQ